MSVERRGAVSALVAVAAVLLVIGVYAWAWGGRPAMEGDSRGYLDVALDLQDGSQSRLSPRPVGYPLLLLMTGSAESPGLALLVSQLALHAAAVLLMLSLLQRVGASRMAIGIFGAVAALPPFVEHAAFVLSESLVQFCVVSGVVGFAAWVLGGGGGWLLLAAVGLGAAPIVHPMGSLLWLALSICAGVACLVAPSSSRLRRQALSGSAALFAAAALVTGAVVAHNAARFDYVGVSPSLGTRLAHKTVRVLELLPDEYAGAREVLIRHRDAALLDPVTGHLGLAYIFRAIPDLEVETGLAGPALSDYLVRLNLELIKRAPMDYGDEVLRSAIWFWAPGVTDRSGFGSGAVKAAFNGMRAGVILAFWAALVLLSGPVLLLVLASRRQGRPVDLAASPVWPRLLTCWILLGAIAYCCVVSITLTSAVYRLRIPVDLPILACAVLGPGLWRDTRRLLRV